MSLLHYNFALSLIQSSEGERSSPEMPSSPEVDPEMEEAEMRQKLIAKQQELLKLQEARLELELAEAAEKLKQKKMLVLETLHLFT